MDFFNDENSHLSLAQLMASDLKTACADWKRPQHIRCSSRKICYRCLSWEREAGSVHRLYPSARSGKVPLGFRSRLFKASEATFSLPMLTQSALRAGRVPALLPFHSHRAFRRAHHTSKQVRRWSSLNINKAYIRAQHPRCELCTPCSPCIPLWFVSSTRSLSPSVLESRNSDHEAGMYTRDAELVERPTPPSSQSSGFAEAERESLGMATCAALATPHLTERPASALGPLERDSAAHGLRLHHGGSDSSSAGSLGKPSACNLRRSAVEGFTSEWHLVDGHPSTAMGGTRYMAETLGGQGIGSSSCVATSIVPDVDGAAEPYTTASSPAGLPASVAGDSCEGARSSLADAADVASGAAADADEISSQVSDQDHAPDALDDGAPPLSVAERSMQALADAGELVAGLIAATVSVSRPASGADEGENISVEMPEHAECVHVTSSEENSPQLVDVLRQSALHDRYRGPDVGSRRFSLEPAVVPDSDMVDVLHDSLVLDDSWVTVEGSAGDGDDSLAVLDQNRGSLEAARGFLRRHVLHRLRPSPGSGQ